MAYALARGSNMLRPRRSFVTVVAELSQGLSDGTLTLVEVPLESAVQRIEVARELQPELVPELMLELELALAKLSSARLAAALEQWQVKIFQDIRLPEPTPQTRVLRLSTRKVLELLVRRAEARNNVLERALTRIQQSSVRSSETRSFRSQQRGKTSTTEP